MTRTMSDENLERRRGPLHAIGFVVVVISLYFGSTFAWRAIQGGDPGEQCIKSHDCRGLMSRCYHGEAGPAYCAPSCDTDTECPEAWTCEETDWPGKTHCVRGTSR